MQQLGGTREQKGNVLDIVTVNVTFAFHPSNIKIVKSQGAGHFVPLDRSGAALQMMSNYLRNTGEFDNGNGIDVSPQPLVPSMGDRIDNLPGLPYYLPFDQHSGYLDGGLSD